MKIKQKNKNQINNFAFKQKHEGNEKNHIVKCRENLK